MSLSTSTAVLPHPNLGLTRHLCFPLECKFIVFESPGPSTVPKTVTQPQTYAAFQEHRNRCTPLSKHNVTD